MKSVQMESIPVRRSIRMKIIWIKSRRIKKSKRIKSTRVESIRMKIISTGNGTELKTALKCLFKKTKSKVQPTK